MHAPRATLIAAMLCASSAGAQNTTPNSPDTNPVEFCHDTTGQDRQPNFNSNSGFDWKSVSLTSDNPPGLRLNTNLEVLNSERIYFPFTQQVSISYLYESAGNSGALGYFYYDDLIARGYIDTKGTPNDTSDDTLVDSDGNGIADFHEDLYSMSITRAYLGGATRRCLKTFKFAANGKSFYEPELASKDCSTTYQPSVTLRDARPGKGNMTAGTVGVAPSGARTGTQFSDQGLYPTIPNLLEPRDDKNNKLGIGHIIFLHADDDTDTSTYQDMTPVKDVTTTFNGIPDYNVSAYDPDGRPLSPVPSGDGLEEERDRTVNLGELQGGKEIVFFFVSWGAPNHASDGSQVYPCLSFNSSTGACALHIITPTNIYFSKTLLNMDQNAQTPSTGTDSSGKSISYVSKRDIGCDYTGSNHCNQTGENLDGWLDSATLNRMKTLDAYRKLTMPHEKGFVKSDPLGRGIMPHAFVGTPSTDKFRWILGFEDLPGGGDRDFNDVTFMIHKSNGAVVRSGIVSGDLSPTISQDYTITEVTFTAQDLPLYSGANASYCQSRPAEDRPRITYQVALDCKVCTANCSTSTPTLTDNPTPTWVDVPLSDPPTDGTLRNQTVTLRDFLQRSLTGSQLCWQAVMTSKDDQCQPTIKNIDVSYKAVKAGDYGRAAVSAVANTVLYGVTETPGRSWFGSSVTPPSTRVVDGRLDLAERGHLYLKELYTPETPSVTSGALLWDGGKKLSSGVSTTDPTGWRKLITMNTSGARAEVKDLILDTNGGEAFSAAACSGVNGGHWDCDLDNSGGPPEAADRALLRNWLYGWEQNTSSAKVKRTWPMGGVQLSTPAIIGAASTPSWVAHAPGIEQSRFNVGFIADSRVANRPTMAYVGTTQGMLHGVKAGSLQMSDDPCTTSTVEARGHFAKDKCTEGGVRDYGTAEEVFAYLPRKLLPTYVASYLRQGNGKRASVDASPSVADVDLGFGTYDPAKPFTSTQAAWTIGTNPGPLEGAKTVLVSPTGPTLGTVFALDITDPKASNYPQPMWEFDMGNDVLSATSATVEDSFSSSGASLIPDTKGSRFSPPIVRMDFGSVTGQKWVAVVGTDYVPNGNTAGAVYLMDLKKGQPLQLAPGTQKWQQLAGVVPLAKNEGLGSNPVAVDSNDDGTYDLLYVSTTKGKLFRISTSLPSVGSPSVGRAFQVCQLADIQNELSAKADKQYQGIYSNIAVQALGTGSAKKVRIYMGTGNNPDLSDEDADKVTPRPNGYLLAYEDSQPKATSCTTLATPLWVQTLGAGQMVWGGVAVAGDNVFTTTAVGKAANACELSGTESGAYYAYNSSTGVAQVGSGTSLGGHSLATPVVHDEHLLMLTADGKVKALGDATKWNNATNNNAPAPVRVRIWDTSPNGRLQP